MNPQNIKIKRENFDNYFEKFDNYFERLQLFRVKYYNKNKRRGKNGMLPCKKSMFSYQTSERN